jgi:CDP-glucose 4,6-dehydratase
MMQKNMQDNMQTCTDIKSCFGGRFAGKTVLVTGHTGFKGSWLCLWLQSLGANVVGYSLPAPTDPNHFELLGLEIESHIGDVRDLDRLTNVYQSAQPEIIFHLAAQPLVRLSYDQPVETFTSNVTGTVNVLEAARRVDSVRAIVSVTSDKVYENFESEIGYRESDRLGGSDPYSCSKACAELIVKSYRNSFFPISKFENDHSTLIATARAGNVFGGGDWALDRLIPDAVRAASVGERLQVRHPGSVRPWQHVLEPLTGYLLLADRLLSGEAAFAKEWNFGPDADSTVSVANLVEEMQLSWPQIDYDSPNLAEQPHETNILKLDSSQAQNELNWHPVWEFQTSVRKTANWYRSFYESEHVNSLDDLSSFIEAAANCRLEWAQ